jgi:hypothetical protein
MSSYRDTRLNLRKGTLPHHREPGRWTKPLTTEVSRLSVAWARWVSRWGQRLRLSHGIVIP